MKKIFILLLLIVSIACNKEELYSDLEKLSGKDVIEIGTHNVSGNIGKIFSKYVYTKAPNGRRIEIFGTSGVTDEQMLYARDILEQYLTSDGTVYKRKYKEIIANSMANKRSAMVFWDTEEQYSDNIMKVEYLGYSVQDLYATESLGMFRDASYEEILHLVHNHGITSTLFNFQGELQKANDDALSRGIWKPWEGLPKADYDDEYLAALMDCYLGLWDGLGPTFWGAYEPSSREEMKTLDPIGHQLILDLFGDIQQVR